MDEEGPLTDMATKAYEPRPARTVNFHRRKELVAIAGQLIERALAAGVKPHEWCFLRRAASMMAEDHG